MSLLYTKNSTVVLCVCVCVCVCVCERGRVCVDIFVVHCEAVLCVTGMSRCVFDVCSGAWYV